MTTINLGCGNSPIDGAINHDKTAHSPFVDEVWDIEQAPWPWCDEAFSEIVAQDLLEHLHLGFIEFFDEAWRVLEYDGTIVIRTPMWNSPNAVIDPTHVRCYHPESFHYLDSDTFWGQKYGFYTPHKWHIEWLSIDLANIHVVLRKINTETER